jgi:XTP/dITP diphosphohydrolase
MQPGRTPTARVLLATRNEHKVRELRAILGSDADLADQVDLSRAVAGLDGFEAPDVAETGVTFADNALLKARAASGATGLPALADDSGLSVDVLGGSPGVFSARWCGRHGDDDANLRLLLAQLQDVPEEHRGARFVCAMALVMPGTGREVVEHGEMPGRLTSQPRGENGFGYDPIFRPQGLEVTSAELSDAEKNRISHRGAATRAIIGQLRPILLG